MSDDSPEPRCIHEILNEAAQFNRDEDAESLPRLDAVAAAIRDFLPTLHVEGNAPEVIEGIAAGIHIGCLRFAGYLQLNLIPEEVNDVALHVMGEVLQALAILYVEPSTPSAADLTAAFEGTDTTPAAATGDGVCTAGIGQ